MGIIGWIVLGGIAGWIASAIMGTKEGCILDVILGIVGALVGGFLWGLIRHHPDGAMHFRLGTLVIAVIGACIVLAIKKAVMGSNSTQD